MNFYEQPSLRAVGASPKGTPLVVTRYSFFLRLNYIRMGYFINETTIN